MTSEELIAEGRKLAKPCLFLRPDDDGRVVAVWHEHDREQIDATGERAWLTVDARYVPGLSPAVSGYLTIFTNEAECEGGRVEQSASWPRRTGTPLCAQAVSVLPPIDAVFARGSEAVARWLALHGWERTDRYDGYFPDEAVVREYERVWMNEFPLYIGGDVYAALGGWHMPWPDGDWHDLIDDHLMLFTLRDSEPWVEAWHSTTGQFRIFQRIT